MKCLIIGSCVVDLSSYPNINTLDEAQELVQAMVNREANFPDNVHVVVREERELKPRYVVCCDFQEEDSTISRCLGPMSEKDAKAVLDATRHEGNFVGGEVVELTPTDNVRIDQERLDGHLSDAIGEINNAVAMAKAPGDNRKGIEDALHDALQHLSNVVHADYFQRRADDGPYGRIE